MKQRAQGQPQQRGNGRQQAAAAVAAAAAAAAAAAGGAAGGSGGGASGALAPGTASYRRPNTLRTNRPAPAHTPDRFEREVLGGRLWHGPCQAAASGDIGEQIPLSFSSMDEYVHVFEPLVLEEAREGLKSDWAENCVGGRAAWAVEVVGVEEVAEGWCNVRLRALQGHGSMLQECVTNTAVVLSVARPPPRGAIEWAQSQVADRGSGANGGGNGGGNGRQAAKRQRLDPAAAAAEADAPSASVDSSGEADPGETADSSAAAAAAAGPAAAKAAGAAAKGAAAAEAAEAAGRVVAGIVRRGQGDELLLQVHPCCTHHAYDRTACCWAALNALQRSSSAAGGARKRWWLVPGKMLISSQREFDAVHRVRQIEKSLLRFMLKPQLLAPIGEYYDNPEVRRSLWPEQAAQPQFINYLRQRYDETQLEAIEMAACHLGAPEATAADGSAYGSSGRGRVAHPLLPFVLVQGPPGTGKTHTVKGMLNVWHLVAYQRYYDGLIAATAPAAAGTGSRQHNQQLLNPSGSNILDVVASSMLSDLGRAVAQTKPRILICTPSNAACDELLTRVMSEGFCDGSGRVYRPNVVRVGSEKTGINPTVKDRLVGLMVERYRSMSQKDWQHRYADLQQRHSHVSRELEALEISLTRAAKQAAVAAAAAATKGGSGGSGELEAAQQQHMELAKKLVERAQQQQRYEQEVERLQLARELVWGRRDMAWKVKEAERNIEASFLFEAEMVFTTLSSTQRQVFQQSASKAPFHTVLIDEAGQASEVAALQPLVFGAKRVVLVGDPQQLPATILSELAKQVQMERSLFERLQQQGAPVKMLSVQYRMHPAIRQFPSAHFYGGRLRDADAIRDTPPAPFYDHPLLKPYVFFDVARGKEQRQGGGGSVSNKAEALMAACLFAELRQFLINRAQQQPGSITGPTTVGVITPYREQRSLLRQTFEEVCGRGPASEVFIETVDSFQGKQLDVVMLSCVRASSSGGLGFVNDIRRMNVAITRAKRSLWVLGSRATLRSNPEWNALISDAEERGVVIADAGAADLFPDLPYWRGQLRGQQAAAGGEERQQQQQQQAAADMRVAMAEGLAAPLAAAGAAAAAAATPPGVVQGVVPAAAGMQRQQQQQQQMQQQLQTENSDQQQPPRQQQQQPPHFALPQQQQQQQQQLPPVQHPLLPIVPGRDAAGAIATGQPQAAAALAAAGAAAIQHQQQPRPMVSLRQLQQQQQQREEQQQQTQPQPVPMQRLSADQQQLLHQQQQQQQQLGVQPMQPQQQPLPPHVPLEQLQEQQQQLVQQRQQRQVPGRPGSASYPSLPTRR